MHYRLADHGLVFSSRDRGARMLRELRASAVEAPPESLTIDFTGVRSMSYSFTDEFVGAMVQDAVATGAPPLLVNPTPKVARLIERSLTRRGLNAEQLLASALEAH